MKLARFLTDVYESGLLAYAAGKHYVINETTTRQVALGNAEETDVKVDPAKAEKLAVKAQEAAEKAVISAQLARADADAAAEAQRLSDEASAALAAGQSVQTTAQAEAKALRDAANVLADELKAAGEAFQQLEQQAVAAPDDADLQLKVKAAAAAGIELSDRHEVAVKAADAAEAALED